MDTLAEVEIEEDSPKSRKREITATTIATIAALGLSVVASIAVGKIQQKIHDRIATPEETTEEA